jgi:PAS domain S-box-containing protein
MNKLLRILQVEDCESDAALIVRLLEKAGYEVHSGRVETDAEMRTALTAPGWDVVIADYRLPQFDGMAALKVLQQTGFDIPFIIVSGTVGEEIAVEVMKAGAQDYLPKDKLRRLAPAVGREIAEAQSRRERRQAEQDRREAENRYRVLFEQSPDGVVILDPQTARPLEFNEAAHRGLGYSRQEFAGLTLADIEAAETPEEIRARIEAVVRTGRADFETRQRTRTGALRNVHVTAQVIEVTGRRVYHCVWRDITERKQLEAEREITVRVLRLLNSSNRLNELLREVTLLLQQWSGCEAVGIRMREGEDYPYFETRGLPPEHVRRESSLCARDADGTVRRDPAGCAILECLCGSVLRGALDVQGAGLTHQGAFWTNSVTEFMAGIPVAELPSDLRGRCLQEGYESLALFPLRTGATVHGLLQFNDRRKGRFTPQSIALLEHLADSLTVAIAHRQAQEKLRVQGLVLDQTKDTVTVTDLKGRITYVNAEQAGKLGFAAEELVGKSPQASSDEPAQAITQEQILQRTLAEGAWHGEVFNYDRAGKRLEVECRAFTVRDETGRPIALCTVGTDITERKRLEAQFRQAQKLEAIGQLAGGVAHDFNNILAATMMHLGLLEHRPNLDAELSESLKELMSQAERAASLTRQLLLFGRRSVMQVQCLNLNDLVENLLKMLRRLIGEDITLRWQGRVQLPPVMADPGMLEQVLMNLVVNARDAMPTGGQLTIATDMVKLTSEQALNHPQGRPGRFVCLTVADTGCGMDDATLKRMFEPFFTTKEAGKGTGLGLATVYGIVSQHQGWITVESAVGKGSTFAVFFPVAAEPAAEPAPRTKDEPVRGGNEMILLVEDDPAVRISVSLLLRRYGYEVLEANNGAAAVGLWEHRQGQIRLLFTDMVMPEGMTGLDLARKLRITKPDLKVIVSSGYSAELVHHGGEALTGILYLPKPCPPSQLAAAVRRCLDEARD